MDEGGHHRPSEAIRYLMREVIGAAQRHAEREREREREALSGHQWPSAAISGHQRPSEAISGHQRTQALTNLEGCEERSGASV